MAKKPIKSILFVVPYGFNDRMGNYVEFTAGRLLANNGWQVFALVNAETGRTATDTQYGISVYRAATAFAGIRWLLTLFLRQRPAVIHIIALRNNRLGIIAAGLAKLCGSTLVCTEYGLLHDHYFVADRDDPLSVPFQADNLVATIGAIARKAGPLSSKVKNYLFHWPLTHADRTLFVTVHNVPLAQRLGLRNVTHLPYLLDKARWDERSVETTPAVASESERALALVGQLNSPYALFVGQLKRRKGWDILLRALPFIPSQQLPQVIFITPSVDDEPEELQALLAQPGIREHVHFFRKITSPALAELYRRAAVVILPSRYEGFGLAAVESFENKTPLIAADVPAINEHVRHEYNGLLFPAKDHQQLAQAIGRLMGDRQLQNRLVQGGRETIATFKSETREQQWLAWYRTLI